MKIINNKKNEFKKSSAKIKYGFFEKVKNFMIKPAQKILINMELDNGDKVQDIVKVENHTFKYLNAKYIIDQDYLKYNRTFKLYESYHHQSLSLPIKFEIDSNLIIQDLKDDETQPYADIINNINPVTLKEFVDSKIIQNSLQGQAMTQIFGFIKLMLIIICIISAISLLIMINVSGIFN